MTARGHALTPEELANMELAYIGGLLGLDIQFDKEAREKAFTDLESKHGPSPERRG